MPSRRPRQRRTVSSFDLYAQAMLDHWLGKKVVFEFERDDGYRSRSLVEAYFTPPAKWSKIEREAMRASAVGSSTSAGAPGRPPATPKGKDTESWGSVACPRRAAWPG